MGVLRLLNLPHCHGCDIPKHILISCDIQEVSMAVMGLGEIGWWPVYGRFMS